MSSGTGRLSRSCEEELAVWLVSKDIAALAGFAHPAITATDTSATMQILLNHPEPSPGEQLWRWLVQAECVLASVSRGRISQNLLKSGQAREILDEWNNFIQDQAADLKSRARSILGGFLTGRSRQGVWPALTLARCLQMPVVNIGWDGKWTESMVARLRMITPNNRGASIALLLAFLWRDAGALVEDSTTLETASGCVFTRISDLVRCIRMPDAIFLERPGIAEPRIFQPAIQACGQGENMVVVPPTLLVPPLSVLQERFRTLLKLSGAAQEHETARFLSVNHWQQTEAKDREPLVSLLFPANAVSGVSMHSPRAETIVIPPVTSPPGNAQSEIVVNQVGGGRFHGSLLAVLKSMGQPLRDTIAAPIIDLEQAVAGRLGETANATWLVRFANRLLQADQAAGIRGEDLLQARLALGIIRDALQPLGCHIFPAVGADDWVFDTARPCPIAVDDQAVLECRFHARVSLGERFLTAWGEGANGQVERAPCIAISAGKPTPGWVRLNRFLGETDHALNGIADIMSFWAGNNDKVEQARFTAERLTVERYSDAVKSWLAKAGTQGAEFDSALSELLMELGGYVFLFPANGPLSMIPETQIRIVNKASARHFSNITRVVCPGLLGPTGIVMAARVEVD